MLNEHYERWTAYWTSGKGRFVMEDSRVVNALQQLGEVGRADPNRILTLRTGSRYSMRYPGEDAITSLVRPGAGGLEAALNDAYTHIVAGQVVNEMADGWRIYYETI